MLAAAIIIAAAMALTRHDVAYLLVLVWAVVGIAVKRLVCRPSLRQLGWLRRCLPFWWWLRSSSNGLNPCQACRVA